MNTYIIVLVLKGSYIPRRPRVAAVHAGALRAEAAVMGQSLPGTENSLSCGKSQLLVGKSEKIQENPRKSTF